MAETPLPRFAARPLRFLPSFDVETALLFGLLLYLGALVLVPLARLAVESLAPGAQGQPLGLLFGQWTSLSTRRALADTVGASLLATLLSLVLGVLAAVVLTVTDVRAKAALAFLTLLPLLVPSQITALAWIELAGPSSPVLQPLGLAPPPGTTNPLYSMGGIVLVMGVEHSALVFLTVRASLVHLPRELVEAARLGGAGPLRAVAAIVLPLVRPAILAGGAISFVSSIGNFGVPAMLGIPGRYLMLTTLIYQRLQGFGPSALGEVAAIAMILAALAAFGLVVRSLLARRIAAAERTGARIEPFRLGRWRPVTEFSLWIILSATAILPLFALVAGSLVPALGVPLDFHTITLANYRFALVEEHATLRALRNSFVLASSAALVSTAVAIPIAYCAILRERRLARVLDAIAEIPYAVPGTVLAIAMILAFLRPLPLIRVSFYDTIWILLIAYLARFLALAVRPTVAGLQSVDRAVDEAGRLAGAGLFTRLVFIISPIAAPSAVAGGLLIFMIALNELTVSALLWSTGNETLGVVMFFLHDEGNTPAASAVATLSIAATLALAGAVSLFGRNLPEGVVPWRA